MTTTMNHWLRVIALSGLAAIVLTGGVLPARAQMGAPMSGAGPLQVIEEENAVLIEWDGGEAAASGVPQTLPTVRFGCYELPMHLLTVQVVDEVQAASAPVELGAVQSAVLDSAPGCAEPLKPPALGLDEDPLMGQPEESRVLPQAPVTVLREGRLRGVHLRVLAVSPVYAENGAVRVASRFSARLPGVAPVSDPAQLAAASIQAGGEELGPVNAAAAVDAARIRVSTRGMQEITGQMLAGAGLGAPPINRLRLTFKGQPTAIEVNDANGNGTLEANETLRFYAAASGDYWNAEEIYWLTVETTASPAITTRSATPGSAPVRTSAIEDGVWRNSQVYISLHPGPDSDHWYSMDMRVEPSMQGKPEQYPSLTAELRNRLPLDSGGSASFLLHLNTYKKGEYQLRVKMGTDQQDLTLDTFGDIGPARVWEPKVTTASRTNSLQLTLIPGDNSAGLLVDSVDWQQPVKLIFGGAGAIFSGVTGTWRYEMSNLPSGAVLYDISDPLQPVRLTGISTSFQDGPEIRTYLLAGSGTVHTPVVTAHSATVFSAADGAHIIYIVPAALSAPLQPLISHRQAQGYQVKSVAVEDIYDAWGYGHVGPDAIRDFLRFAFTNWQPSPAAVVLVGDGTRDPRNFEGKGNPNLIPPYLADVDPWLGQAACERCFVQLDGDDPVTNELESPDGGFMPDMQIGRFPVKNAAELGVIVDKLLRYETVSDRFALWRSTAVFLADDYIRPDGKPDAAGNFHALSNDTAALMPRNAQADRIYFDPTYRGGEPWREPNAVRVRERTIDAMNSGPGLVTYNGHANHWVWASTDLSVQVPHIFQLYDADVLQNRDQLFINLSMTCYSSQFQQPAVSGTTLDERLILNANGGAVAVWGPSGLSVAHGHDKLQEGFHKALWAAPPFSARIGDLLDAGYYNQMTTSNCCHDVQQTFLLLGDPFMTVGIRGIDRAYLPVVNR